ncbi:LysR family transcriptional regulator [Pseudothauera lacus]|uniref:LysR family transcriptional regulator n=1 Tax=Pseudothauera lacus TaxID=2136175 RepID=A0A2T4IGH8_9RHOO|nr:LysR family transcriptional regulator [Pseudothauera lacus]PTD96882.1 LysR family transcriptional regulator [Pseudothauera lacus]
MSRLQQMQTFVAVAEAGSFAAAAEQLGSSRPAVSRQIAELERRLDVRLLHRTTRRLSLSAEGEVFLARCKRLLGDLDEAEAEITVRSGQAIGLLRVNAPVSFGIARLAPLWGRFQARHPRVELDITLSDRIVDLVEEGYDLAIRISRLPDSTMICRRLSSTRLLLCASPAYLARAGTPTHPGELAAHATLAYSYFAGGDEWPFHGPDGPISARVRPTLRSNNGDTCVAGALQHQGIVLQPDFLVDEHLASGQLVELMPAYRSLELGIYAVYPSRKHLTPKLRLLIDHLAAHFSASADPPA